MVTSITSPSIDDCLIRMGGSWFVLLTETFTLLVFPKEATAVALKAIEEKIARKIMSEEEIYQNAYNIIKRSRDTTQVLMDNGLIQPMPE